jgi:fructoselysine-6-P-deglycase FrlB-like protein
MLADLQPSPGFMRLVKDRVLVLWQRMRKESRAADVAADRRLRTLQDKLDHLDDAFLSRRRSTRRRTNASVTGAVRS